jgi:flagellar protein FliT
MESNLNISIIDLLLDELLSLTVSLENRVKDNSSEPTAWIDLLDQRQEVIDKLSGLIATGYAITEDQRKKYIEPAYRSDQRIIAIMNNKKDNSEMQLARVRRNRAVSEQYSDYGRLATPYGAFLDKKK